MGSAVVTLTICNCTDIPSGYEFLMKSAISGVTFSPPSGGVMLQPGECIDIDITVYCPNVALEGIEIFANVSNLTTGSAMQCPGLVKPVQSFKVTPTDPVIVTPLPTLPTPVPVSLVISNIGSTGKDGVEISWSVMGAGFDPCPDNLCVLVAQGQTMVVNATVILDPLPNSVTEGGGLPGAPRTAAVLISWDDDGDGVPEVNSSVNLRFEGAACAGDLNGDGIVNGADLAGLLANWGLCQ